MDELPQLHPFALSELADRLLVVFDERLLAEDALGVEILQAALYHLVDDVGRLAFLEGRVAEDLALFVD